MKVFIEAGRRRRQNGDDLPLQITADMPHIFPQYHIYRIRGGSGSPVSPVRILYPGHHNRKAQAGRFCVPQQAHRHRHLTQFFFRIIIFLHRVQEQREKELRLLHLLFHPVRPGEHLKLPVQLLLHLGKLFFQVFCGDWLQQITDDVVLDRLLGVGEIIISAQEHDLHCRAHLPDLPCQLDPIDERHPDIRDQEIRFQLFHHLKRVRTVFRLPDHAETHGLPFYIPDDPPPDPFFIFCNDYCIHAPFLSVNKRSLQFHNSIRPSFSIAEFYYDAPVLC